MTHRSAPESGVRLGALTTACLASLVVGLAGELIWRWIAIHALDVSASLSAIQAPSLVISALLPVIGNGFGYFMAFRRHVSRALLLFLGPGALMTGVGLAVLLVQLPPSAGIRAVVITVVVGLTTPVVTVAILLTRKNLRRIPVPLAAAPSSDLPSDPTSVNDERPASPGGTSVGRR